MWPHQPHRFPTGFHKGLSLGPHGRVVPTVWDLTVSVYQGTHDEACENDPLLAQGWLSFLKAGITTPFLTQAERHSEYLMGKIRQSAAYRSLVLKGKLLTTECSG